MSEEWLEAQKHIALYGKWKSDIDLTALSYSERHIDGAKVCPRTGRIYVLQARADGTYTIFEYVKNTLNDLLSSDFDVRSAVHEYGGGAWNILYNGDIIFSNGNDNAVYIIREVQTSQLGSHWITDCLIAPTKHIGSEDDRNKREYRYAEFTPHPTEHEYVVAIEEVHTVDTVTNRLVALDLKTGDRSVKTVEDHDFFTKPGFSPDGKIMTWLQWDHPDMPWTGAQIVYAPWRDEDDELRHDICFSVTAKSGPCAEPKWGLDGRLYFLQEQGEFRQIFSWTPGDQTSQPLILKGLDEAEFGGCEWLLGSNTYAFLSKTAIIAAYTKQGRSNLVVINPKTGQWQNLHLDLQAIQFDAIAVTSSKSFLVVGATSYSPQALYHITLAPLQILKLVDSSTEHFPRSIFSTPQHIIVPSSSTSNSTSPDDNQLPIHAIYFPPHNPRYKGPSAAKPPLIIFSHGGPTSHTNPGLSLRIQFWTSRGFAVLALNYRGSDGYGRTYRRSLNSHWGEYDVADAAACANYLSETGVIDGSRVGIRGGSAGGYLVLQAVCEYPHVFAGAVSEYGVSDVKKLAKHTHKFESHYIEGLLFTKDMSTKQREQIMHDRSPLYHADKIRTPLLLLQGGADKVVPPEQAYAISDAIRKQNGDVRLVIFPKEGHGFRFSKNVEKAVEEELWWWEKTLVRDDDHDGKSK